MGNNKQEPSLRTKVVIELLRAQPPLSMSEIGRMVGLTRQRIRQIDKRYTVRPKKPMPSLDEMIGLTRLRLLRLGKDFKERP